MKLLKQIKNGAYVSKTLSIALTCFILILSSINVKAATLGEHKVDVLGGGYGYTAYNATYGITVSVTDTMIEFIRQDYGDDAVNAYIQGVVTGDYYQYRSITGFWQPTQLDPTLKSHAMSNKANPIWYITLTSATMWESVIYDQLGPYATAADFVSLCQQYGVAKPFASSGEGSYTEAVLFNGMPTKATWITKAQYLANHQNTTAIANTSSNASVEELRTYSGNTSEFNAYTYYTRYADLQSAIGANGDALLKHWQAYGKAESRIAN